MYMDKTRIEVWLIEHITVFVSCKLKTEGAVHKTERKESVVKLTIHFTRERRQRKRNNEIKRKD